MVHVTWALAQGPTSRSARTNTSFRGRELRSCVASEAQPLRQSRDVKVGSFP